MDRQFATEVMDAAVRQRLLVMGTVSEDGIESVYIGEDQADGRELVIVLAADDRDLMTVADLWDGVYVSDDNGDPFEFSSAQSLLDLLQCEAEPFNLFAVCPEHGNIVACTVPARDLANF